MHLVRHFAAAFLLAAASIGVAVAAGERSDGCRCATTFQGTGATRKVVCEGFNPQTHERCPCDQVQVNQQVGCRPSTASAPGERPSAPPQRKAGR